MDLTTITDRQLVFLDEVAKGKSIQEAGKKSGYAAPAQMCYPLLTKPEVRKRFRKHQRGLAETEGISTAYAWQDLAADEGPLPQGAGSILTVNQ